MAPKKDSTKEASSGPTTPSDVLSKREIDLLCYAMLANPDNLTLSGAEQAALAKTAGFTNPKSLGNALRAIKQKLSQFQADSGAGAANDADGDGKKAGKGGKKRTTAKKRARDVTEDGEEGVVKKVKSEDEGDVEA
jgi:hypothetical protein